MSESARPGCYKIGSVRKTDGGVPKLNVGQLHVLYQTDRRDRQMTFDEWLRSREQGGK